MSGTYFWLLDPHNTYAMLFLPLTYAENVIFNIKYTFSCLTVYVVNRIYCNSPICGALVYGSWTPMTHTRLFCSLSKLATSVINIIINILTMPAIKKNYNSNMGSIIFPRFKMVIFSRLILIFFNNHQKHMSFA
jgi:hypothetical protein